MQRYFKLGEEQKEKSKNSARMVVTIQFLLILQGMIRNYE